jgi:hypothetical protein
VVSSEEKSKCWPKIAKDFNSQNPRYTDFCIQQTRKTAAKENKETHKTGGESKKNNKGNSSSELILSSVNKKTVQGLTNEFDCDATLEPAELEVNKIKVKCAFIKQLRNIL